jgi:hypothetical protein
MNEEDKIIDQSELAKSVGEKIKYSFFDHFLIKPLDPIKVTKEFSKPVSTGTPAKDENGVEAQDFDNVETEVKEVNSDYLKGVVIKLPMYYESPDTQEGPYKDIRVGDIVVFRATAGLPFDLVRDSRLIRLYDILGVEK